MIHAQTRPLPTVPFKGCISEHQIETLSAPMGMTKRVTISASDARMLGYYESPDGIGLLAPRGWYCQGSSGSAGAALWLSPEPIHIDQYGARGLAGPAIEYNLLVGGSSESYAVAEVIARVFPEYIAFARGVWMDLDRPMPTSPYAKDKLVHKSRAVVEFTTPARIEGLGNFDSWMGKSDDPISGVAILTSTPADPFRDPPDIILLAVRLPSNMRRLAPSIIHYVESSIKPAK